MPKDPQIRAVPYKGEPNGLAPDENACKGRRRESPEAEDALSQRRRPELGRYLLQVDRQTKGSYTTSNAAQSAALAIKTGHPIVQVSVYDAVENTNRIVEAPAAAEHVTSGGDAASAIKG
jgi:hypothetical protein